MSLFGLPELTTLVLFGIPAFWVVYTMVFLWRTRHWEDDGEA